MQEFFSLDMSKLSIFALLGLVLLGGVLYLAMSFIQKFGVLLVVKSPLKRKEILALLPAYFTLVWILFSFYVFFVLIQPFPFLGVLLAIGIIYMGRGYFVHLIHGLFFRLKKSIVVGQTIGVHNHSGTVVSLHTFDLELENREGEIILIPYGSLVEKELIKMDFSTHFSSHKFTLISPADLEVNEMKKKLLSQPWVSSMILPKVLKNKSGDNQFHYSILVYTIDEKYNPAVESDLRKKMNF